MATILDEAEKVLNDLELKISAFSLTLRDDEREAFSDRIAQAQSEFETLIKKGTFTELDLSEVANKLLDSLTAYTATAELISSNEERAAQLDHLEKSESNFTRAVRPTHLEKSKVEQYRFLANQIINKCQIVRKAIDSERRNDAESRPAPTPR